MSEQNSKTTSVMESAVSSCWNTLWGGHTGGSASPNVVVVEGSRQNRKAQRIKNAAAADIRKTVARAVAAAVPAVTAKMFESGFAPHGGPVPSTLPGKRTSKKYEMVLTPYTMKDWNEALSSLSEDTASAAIRGVGSLVVHMEAMAETDSQTAREIMKTIGGKLTAPHLTLHGKGTHEYDIAPLVGALYGDNADKAVDFGLVLDNTEGGGRTPLPEASHLWDAMPNLVHFRFQDNTEQRISSTTLSRLEDYAADKRLGTLSVSSADIDAAELYPLAKAAAKRSAPLDYLHLSVLSEPSKTGHTDLGVFLQGANNVYLCYSLALRDFAINDLNADRLNDGLSCGVLVLEKEPEGRSHVRVSNEHSQPRVGHLFSHSEAKAISGNIVMIVEAEDSGYKQEQLRRFKNHENVPGGRFTLTSFGRSLV